MKKQATVVIETPEKIRFSYHIAEIGTRIAAYIIDELIQIGVVLLLILPLLFGGFSLYSQITEQFANYNLAFLMIVIFLSRWFYFILFEIIMEGQSPGKKLMKIRVIRGNGDSLDPETIVLRNFIRVVDGFPMVPLLGGFVALLDARNRRLGDLVANTLVVNEIHYDLRVPDFQVHFSHRPAAGEAFSSLRQKLTENELYIIRRFLNDYTKLPPGKQQEVAANLAEQVKKRLDVEEPVSDAFRFLERIYQQHGK